MTFQRGDTLSVGWRHKRGYPHLGWLHERGIPPDVGWCHERRDTRWWKSSVLQNRKWLLINYVELTFAVILYNSLLFSFYAKEKRKAHYKLDDRPCQKLGRYPLMTSSLEYLKRRRSLLRTRDVFVQPLRQDFLFQSHLKRHQEFTHRQSTSFSCPVCNNPWAHQPTVAAVPSTKAEDPMYDLHGDPRACLPVSRRNHFQETQRDACVQHLWQDFLFQESSEETPRHYSSSTRRLFLSSMQQTLTEETT